MFEAAFVEHPMLRFDMDIERAAGRHSVFVAMFHTGDVWPELCVVTPWVTREFIQIDIDELMTHLQRNELRMFNIDRDARQAAVDVIARVKYRLSGG